MEYGYIKKRHAGAKKPKITSKPFHYLSSDGFHIYEGINNYQNEELTFKLATGLVVPRKRNPWFPCDRKIRGKRTA